jgi:hypothetical protein
MPPYPRIDMALKNGSYTTDKTTMTMPQIRLPSSDLEESTDKNKTTMPQIRSQTSDIEESTDKNKTTMPQIRSQTSNIEESTSAVDTCVLCGCMLPGSTEKWYKKLQVCMDKLPSTFVQYYCWLCENELHTLKYFINAARWHALFLKV